MKFTCSVEVDLPKEKVVEIWMNPDNLKHWQDGFERYEHLSGTLNQTGAKGVMHYNNRGKAMKLVEVVIEGNLPDVFEGEYIHTQMINRMRNTFQTLGPDKTRWTAEIHYIKFYGFFMKTFAFFGKKIFKKQTQKWLDQFKAFAESKN